MNAPPPFDALEIAFRLLGADPYPLAVDGCELGSGLPRRQISIVELRSILSEPATSSDLHHHVIEVVLGRMRRQRAAWTVVLLGLLLPGLRYLEQQLTASDQRPPGDVEAELLSRLLAATSRPRDAHRLAMQLFQLAQASPSEDSRREQARQPPDQRR